MLPFYKIIIFFFCFSFKWLNFIPQEKSLPIRKEKGRKFIMLWNWLSDFKRQSGLGIKEKRERKMLSIMTWILSDLKHINFSLAWIENFCVNLQLSQSMNLHLIFQIKKGEQSIWPKFLEFDVISKKSFSTWNCFHFIHCSIF